MYDEEVVVSFKLIDDEFQLFLQQHDNNSNKAKNNF